jgi:hypothetical protein
MQPTTQVVGIKLDGDIKPLEGAKETLLSDSPSCIYFAPFRGLTFIVAPLPMADAVGYTPPPLSGAQKYCQLHLNQKKILINGFD